jgi:hypothetical protein
MAEVEKIASIRVMTDDRDVALMMEGLKEDVRIVCDLPREVAEKLTADLIAAGFATAVRGGR